MNCVGHINHGLWTHPRDHSTRYNDLEYWTELAQTAGARAVRRPVHRRHRRRLRRLPATSVDVPLRRVDPDAGQRSAAAGLGHGGGDEAPRLRPDRQPHLRAAVPVRPPHVDAGSPDRGPRRLEHRHRLSRQRRHGHGPDANRSSTTAATTRPTSTWRCSTSSGKAAGRTARCCAIAQRGIYADPDKVHTVEHKGEFYQVDGLSPVRALAAAHAGAVPGRRFGARLRFAGATCRVRVHQRPDQGVDQGAGGQGARQRRRGRAQSRGHQGVHGPERDRWRHRGAGLGQARRVPELRQCRGRRGALLGVHRDRFFSSTKSTSRSST